MSTPQDIIDALDAMVVATVTVVDSAKRTVRTLAGECSRLESQVGKEDEQAKRLDAERVAVEQELRRQLNEANERIAELEKAR